MSPAILDVRGYEIEPGDRLSEGETVVSVRQCCGYSGDRLGCTTILTLAETSEERRVSNHPDHPTRVARA